MLTELFIFTLVSLRLAGATLSLIFKKVTFYDTICGNLVDQLGSVVI